MTMRSQLLITAALLGSCASPDLTEIVVHVAAEPSIRRQVRTLDVKVTPYGQPSATPLGTDSALFDDDEYVIVLAPDKDRVDELYRLEVSATKSGVSLVTARLVAGYVEGETRHVRLLLEDRCVEVACSADTSCHEGRCIPARRDASSFAKAAARAPLTTDLEPMDPLGPDAGTTSEEDESEDDDEESEPVPSRDAGPRGEGVCVSTAEVSCSQPSGGGRSTRPGAGTSPGRVGGSGGVGSADPSDETDVPRASSQCPAPDIDLPVTLTPCCLPSGVCGFVLEASCAPYAAARELWAEVLPPITNPPRCTAP